MLEYLSCADIYERLRGTAGWISTKVIVVVTRKVIVKAMEITSLFISPIYKYPTWVTALSVLKTEMVMVTFLSVTISL